MQRPACRCSDFEAQGSGALAHLMPPHLSVLVHMHHLEFGRASSTGGLLVQSLGGCLAPLKGCEEALAAVTEGEREREGEREGERERERERERTAGGDGGEGGEGRELWATAEGARDRNRAEVTLAGLSASEARLERLAADPKVLGAVLWPGEDSVLPCEVRELAGSRPICVVALDATWHSGRRLSQRVPEGLVRVRLPPMPAPEWEAMGARSLLAPARRYRGPSGENGRVSTLEATAMLLEEFGAPPELGRGLRDNLRRHVDRVLTERGREAFYVDEEKTNH